MTSSSAHSGAPDSNLPDSGPVGPESSRQQAAHPSDHASNKVTVVHVAGGFPPVPGFLSADAPRHPAAHEGSGTAAPAASPTLESEVKRLQAALDGAAVNARAQHSDRGHKSPSRAVARDAYPGLLTAMLSRPGYAVAGMAVASVVVAAVVGALVFVVLPQMDDWDLAELPQTASRETAPQLQAPEPSSAPVVIESASEQQVQPAPRQETRPAGGTMEVAALDMTSAPPAKPGPSVTAAPETVTAAPETVTAAPETVTAAPESAATAAKEPARPAPSEPENSERAVFMIPEPPSLAPPAVTAPEPPAKPVPPVVAAPGVPPQPRSEVFGMAAREPAPPAMETHSVVRVPPRAETAAAPDRSGFQFADSDVRLLTGEELQRLPADRLRVARNEIFARKGRLFKDDGLRTYFSQFAWYQPRGWDVPLSAVEKANVDLIQSLENGAAAPSLRSATGSAPAQAQTAQTQTAQTQEAETASGPALPDPRRHYLTAEQLQGLSTEQLTILRNGIFARKGRYFKDPGLRTHFEQFPWYQPHSWDVQLTPVERANVDLIQSVEGHAAAGR